MLKKNLQVLIKVSRGQKKYFGIAYNGVPKVDLDRYRETSSEVRDFKSLGAGLTAVAQPSWSHARAARDDCNSTSRDTGFGARSQSGGASGGGLPTSEDRAFSRSEQRLALKAGRGEKGDWGKNVWRKWGRPEQEAAVGGGGDSSVGGRNKRQHEEAK